MKYFTFASAILLCGFIKMGKEVHLSFVYEIFSNFSIVADQLFWRRFHASLGIDLVYKCNIVYMPILDWYDDDGQITIQKLLKENDHFFETNCELPIQTTNQCEKWLISLENMKHRWKTIVFRGNKWKPGIVPLIRDWENHKFPPKFERVGDVRIHRIV